MLPDLMYDMGSTKPDTKAEADQGTGKVSFLTIEYYQQFFNVDTMVVVERIVNSMIPKRAPADYLKSYIGQNPDLYGPFWITVTLVR